MHPETERQRSWVSMYTLNISIIEHINPYHPPRGRSLSLFFVRRKSEYAHTIPHIFNGKDLELRKRERERESYSVIT